MGAQTIFSSLSRQPPIYSSRQSGEDKAASYFARALRIRAMLGILSKMASALFSNTISISISTLAYGASANAEQRHATVEGKALQALLNGSGADTKHVPKITAGKPSPHEHP